MKKFNPEAWKKNQIRRESSSLGGRITYFDIPKGKSYWKLLPQIGDAEIPFSEAALYFMKDLQGVRRSFRGRTNDFTCPFLKTYVALKNSPDVDKNVLKKMKSSTKFFYNAVNVQTGEIGVLRIGFEAQKDIQSGVDDKIDEGVSEKLFDLSSEYVLKIHKTGETWNTTEYKASFVKLKAQDLNIPDEIDEESLPKLDQIYANLTEEEQYEIIQFNLEEDGIDLEQLFSKSKPSAPKKEVAPKAEKKKVTKEAKKEPEELESIEDESVSLEDDTDESLEDEDFDSILDELED